MWETLAWDLSREKSREEMFHSRTNSSHMSVRRSRRLDFLDPTHTVRQEWNQKSCSLPILATMSHSMSGNNRNKTGQICKNDDRKYSSAYFLAYQIHALKIGQQA